MNDPIHPKSESPEVLKTYVTLKGRSDTDSAESLSKQWAFENGFTLKSFKVIRVAEAQYSLEIHYYPERMEISEEDILQSHSRPPSYGYIPDRDKLLTPFGIATLKDRYLFKSETTPQAAFYRAARAFADDEDHALRIYSYVSRLWFMMATPILSNAPIRESWGSSFLTNFLPERYNSLKRGLPISCFKNSVGDSRRQLNDHYAENALLSSMGGGIGAYWGHIRTTNIKTSSGSESSGAVPFMAIMDRYVLGFAQGETRRASYAMYLDISHPEIIEFMEIRKPTGGDAHRRTLNLHNAVNIPDSFMEIIERCTDNPEEDDSWPLIDPHTHEVVQVVSARDLWQRLLELRKELGEPFIHFIDTSNRALPKAQRDAGLRIYNSNLCTEIFLATNELRTAVCCLSSPNAELFDEWSKDPMFIPDLLRFLDNVLEYFIHHAGVLKESEIEELRQSIRASASLGKLSPEVQDEIVQHICENHLNGMRKAVYSASQERSVGIGMMGFHSYLQSKNIAYESALATSINRRIFSHVKLQAEKATVQLAIERGACPDAKGEMRRNMHLLAVAPNATSSIICGGTSPSTEPYAANAFTHKTQSGSWLVKNPNLVKLLESKSLNTPEIWQSIILNKGSVQHLDFLSEHEKLIFRTGIEIEQRWTIEHAAHRQEDICQGQSVNLWVAANVHVRYVHDLHCLAWRKGLKSLYYLRSEAATQAEAVSLAVSYSPPPILASDCISCEG